MQADKTTEVDLKIKGMSCASCVARVEKAVRHVEGIQSIAVNLATETARVQLSSASLLPQITAAIEKAGYKVETSDLEMSITGMSCASCVARIEKALLKEGAIAVKVNLASERAQVHYHPAQVTAVQLLQAVEKAGYRAKIIHAGD